MKPVDEIKHIQQPTWNSCVSTCLSMIFGLDVEQVIETFHEDYMARKIDIHHWMDANDVKYEFQDVRHSLEWGYVYMVTVPSLNVQAVNHQVVFDLRNDMVEVFDPNMGKDDKLFYVYKPSEKQKLGENEVNINGFKIDYKLGCGESE